MADFRRCITALAVLALFTGFALAQVGPTGQPAVLHDPGCGHPAAAR